MSSHVILGKGQIGSTVAGILARRGETVRVLSRSGGTDSDGITHHRVDASDPDALVAAADGADVIYNCINPGGYHQWAELWPPMASAILTATERLGADLVITGNLYVYGRVTAPMTESNPLSATGSLGKLRAEMWREALRWHESGRIRVAEARGSDYFGPGALDDAILGSRVVGPVVAGKTVQVLGDPDAPHSWTYIPDMAAALVRLAGDDRSWGRAWHVPTAPALSQRQMIDLIAQEAGTAPASVRHIPWWTVTKLAGLVQPRLKYLTQTRHQFDHPYIMDSSAFTDTFGDQPTDTRQAIAETVDWWRRQRS